jgi:DNA-binding transcriptional ArsR family regulator
VPAKLTTVGTEQGIAAVAALVADPTRARFLLELRDSGPLAATELAARAGVSSTAASVHLARLQAAGAIAVERRGRHRFFHLIDQLLIKALAALEAAAPDTSATSARRKRAHGAPTPELKHARTCYDHLGGELGVALTDALLAQSLLVLRGESFELTAEGRARIQEFGIDVAQLESNRRPLTRTCLDWTERRPHLAGALGAALADRMFDLVWLRRRRDTRAVAVTQEGRAGLRKLFGVKA